jgi:arginase
VSRISLLGVPYDQNSSYLRGAAAAPQFIRQALYCDSTNLSTERGLDLDSESFLLDQGDVKTGPEHFFTSIESKVDACLNEKLPVISLGGDHSITYPIISGFNKHYPKLQLLHFDAHPDIYEDFRGNPYSHASPFARIMEKGLADRLVQVGIRTMNRSQKVQVDRFKVEVLEMKDWNGVPTLEFTSPLYISVDLDALDPAYAPGVSHPEPGGLSTRDVVGIIQRLHAPKIVGADIVELNPDRDPLGITAMVAAKILKEIAARMIGG